MTESRALILGNGDAPDEGLWRSLVAASSLVVCADGGANTACTLGAVPDWILGDWDSITEDARTQLAGSRWIDAADQEFSDMDKALAAVEEAGYRHISLAGAEGSRLDHTLANVALLLKYRHLAVTLHAAGEDVFLLQGTVDITLAAGSRLSLLPLFGTSIVRTQGLQYPLSDEPLEPGVRDGLSNRAVAERVSVQSTGAPLLVLVERMPGNAPVFAPDSGTAP